MKMFEFRLISLKFVPNVPINNIPALRHSALGIASLGLNELTLLN